MTDGLSDAERRFGLGAGQFPFRSHFIEIDGSRLHYVDEGTGPVLFMLHGNPTWSFLFRHLISGLRGQFRCVAVDLAGFGLSDAAEDFGYRPDEHANLIAGFLKQLGLHDVTLVAHDWGGPIGLAAMLQSPGQITGLCLGNTYAWPVNGDFHFEFFSRMMGGPVGRFACEHFNFFVNGVMPLSMRRRKLSSQEMFAYRAPFANGRSRRATYVLPGQILAAKNWLQEIYIGVAKFAGPVRFIWPDRDIAFRKTELQRWLTLFPNAPVQRLPQCGHFIWEEAPDECIDALRRWLTG